MAVGIVAAFLSAQLEVIQLRYKPGSTAVILLALFAVSVGWPVARRGSSWRAVAVSIVAATVFAGTAVGLSGAGDRWRFLVHQRQRFVGTVAAWITRTSVPTFEQVMEGDGEAELVDSVGERVAMPSRRATRNVVLVVVDAWRADVLSPWGGKGTLMPRIEQRLTGSMVFRDVQSNASWTSPAMASMMTGLTPEAAGVTEFGDLLREGLVTVSESLAFQGLRTLAVVTNPNLFRGSGFEQGFDVHHELATPDGYLPTDQMTDFVIAVAEREASPQGGTFLFVHLMDPHTPYKRPKENSPLFRFYDANLYSGEIEYLDGVLENMLKKMSDVFGSQTVFVLTSDHGEEFGEHGGWGHGQSLYPELTRVPLMVFGDGIDPAVVEARLEVRDIFHLLLELASSEKPDLESWAERRDRSVRTMSTYRVMASALLWLRPYRGHRMRGVEDGEWLLVRSAFGEVDELYHLASDPTAMRNVVHRHPEVVHRLWQARRAEMDGYRRPVRRESSAVEAEQLRSLGYVE